MARGIKEELQTQFPEIQGLNAQESRFIRLDDALDRAVRRTNNRDIFSLGGKIITGATTSLAGTLGGAEGAGVGALGGIALHYVLSDPMVQSRLAIALNRASRGGLGMGAAQAARGGLYQCSGQRRAAVPGQFSPAAGRGAIAMRSCLRSKAGIWQSR